MRLCSLLAIAVLVSACGTTPARQEPRYRPVPDDRLFAQVARVDGIERADVGHSDSVANPGYLGTVWIADSLSRQEAARAVGTVYAILRQGRPRQPIYIEAIQDDTLLQDLPGLPMSGTVSELREIFGSQPGDGRPPS